MLSPATILITASCFWAIISVISPYPVRLFKKYLHDTYGEVTQSSGSSQSVFGFTGEETDGNGLVNLRARYYNPTLGQFFSLDAFEGDMNQSGSLNRYGYVQGNVINRVDPSGYCAQPTQWWNPFDANCYYSAVAAAQRFSNGDPTAYQGYFDALIKVDWGDLKVLEALGVYDYHFNQSSWSKAIRGNPVASVALAVGAVALIPITLAGGIVFTLAVVGGAAIGGTAGGLGGRTYAEAMYDAAITGQCGFDKQNALLNMGKTAFLDLATSQGILYGTLYGGGYASGPVGQIAVGAAGIVQGGVAIDAARQDAYQNSLKGFGALGSGITVCNAIDALLGAVGILVGAKTVDLGVKNFQFQANAWSYPLPDVKNSPKDTATVVSAGRNGVLLELAGRWNELGIYLRWQGGEPYHGNFPGTNPNAILYRTTTGEINGMITAYAVYNEDGNLVMRVDVDPSSAAHGGVPAPHVEVNVVRVTPRGFFFSSTNQAGGAQWWQVPK